MPRKKATPQKRGRAPVSGVHDDAEREGGLQEVEARQQPQPGRGRRKRQRVGEPAAVESVAAGGASDGDLLGFADLLFCTPSGESAAAVAATAAAAGGVAGRLGVAAERRSRLTLEWDAEAGGPEAPVSGGLQGSAGNPPGLGIRKACEASCPANQSQLATDGRPMTCAT